MRVFRGISASIQGIYVGRRGQRRQPNAIKQLKGSVRHEHDVSAEPVADGAIEPPVWMVHPYALESWHWLVPKLESVGLLACTDADILARYCQAVADYRLALEDIAANGVTYVTGRGTEANRPAWTRQKDAAAEMHRIGAMLGLDPSSRASLGDLGAGTPLGDQLDRWQAQKERSRKHG